MEQNEKFIEICEQLDWNVSDDGEEYCLQKYSPEGEDFFFYVGKNNFVEDVENEYQDFDVDEHVELWVDCRGKSGVPSTIRALVDDAEAIKEMLGQLARALESGAIKTEDNMKRFFYVAVEEENGKYFAFADDIRTDENAKSCRNFTNPKIVTISFCENRLSAEQLAVYWNAQYQKNGTALY